MMHFRCKEEQGLSAIFVHAGAGFHSYQSESMHLWVCDQAARLAMAMLKNGGSAVDAVETAIKFFEDHEITNAGYGSNLTVNGTVECDATMVDHLGRSGAVGAVEHIKNPISLARLVLDASTKPMSLNRVPPNLLVGAGATDFAYEHGMPILPADVLVSNGARDRWLRWKRELDHVEGRGNFEDPMDVEGQDSTHDSSSERVLSPGRRAVSPEGSQAPGASDEPDRQMKPVHSTCQGKGMTADPSDGFIPINRDGYQPNTTRLAADAEEEDPARTAYIDETLHQATSSQFTRCTTEDTDPLSATNTTPPNPSSGPSTSEAARHEKIYDEINDTVGAIAIDCNGNIAAGSSSGGIGMKHCGRTGPAALVGIGTAVIPVDPEDEMETCAAAVASGTGEHMATTMAASTCAERIYASVRKVKGKPGVFESVTEDEAMEAMVNKDFMSHPAVNNSHCHAAIGLMAVKKTKEGIGFFFGHNTESFAVASMSSADNVPWCLMSRSKGDGKVAQGGRYFRFSRYRSSSR
ncbi:hypothetical protein VTO42DRAFT_2075 [Malbranchea cinnamomea]